MEGGVLHVFALIQVPVRVVLGGGVSPSAITSPSVGILLRQGISCFLGLPVANVQIFSVTGNTIAAPSNSTSFIVRADDPVNTQSASCASNGTARQLRMLEGASTLSSGLTEVSLKVRLMPLFCGQDRFLHWRCSCRCLLAEHSLAVAGT